MNEVLFTVFVEKECELNKQRVSIYALTDISYSINFAIFSNQMS